MTATVIKLSIQRMVCTGCGAEANASCNCGKPYVPKAVRAAEAVAANPDKSSRAIAAEIGVDKNVVEKARRELTGEDSPVERIGLDGKKRKLRTREEGRREPSDCDFDYSDPKDAAEPGDTPEMIRARVMLYCCEQALRYANNDAFLEANPSEYDSNLISAMRKAADAWISHAGSNKKWKTEFDGYLNLLGRITKLERRNSLITAALNAKEAQESRSWPADMKPRQIKHRDKCLSAIAAWQRDLEQLYGEVTGQPSWRVEVTTKDGRRLGTGARFGTEFYNMHFAPHQLGDDYATGEIIACEEKPNVLIEGSLLRFRDGDCVLLNWHEAGERETA
jgi:hypothetical protein